MIQKLKSGLLALALVASGVSAVSATPAPVPAPPSMPALPGPTKPLDGSSPECFAAMVKAMPTLAKTNKGANASVTVPNCGTLARSIEDRVVEPSETDEMLATAAGIAPNARRCLEAGMSTEYKNNFNIVVWRVTSRMRRCWDTISEELYSFQNPPIVGFYTTLGWAGKIEGRDGGWEEPSWSARGNTTSTVSIGWQGSPIMSHTVGHQIIVYGNGEAEFTEILG